MSEIIFENSVLVALVVVAGAWALVAAANAAAVKPLRIWNRRRR
jgi:hypothetical protein